MGGRWFQALKLIQPMMLWRCLCACTIWQRRGSFFVLSPAGVEVDVGGGRHSSRPLVGFSQCHLSRARVWRLVVHRSFLAEQIWNRAKVSHCQQSIDTREGRRGKLVAGRKGLPCQLDRLTVSSFLRAEGEMACLHYVLIR